MVRICLQGTVQGRVQGVSFRAATRKKALELGLDGWVRNRPDGTVELQICGNRGSLDTMRAWLANGPPMARVEAVRLEQVTAQPALPGFRITD